MNLGELAPKRVAIVRALRGLGDLLCAVPAWRALRIALPEAYVALVGLPESRPLVERFSHYVDELIDFPGYPGIPERPYDPARLAAFLARVQAEPFDLAIQMHGNGYLSTPFTMLIGARINAGFYRSGDYCPDPERFLPYPEDEPEIRRNLRLIEALGISPQGEALEFPLNGKDGASMRTIAEAGGLRAQSYVCIHPGAHNEAHRWPAQQFAVVADLLAALGYKVLLTGTREEAPVTAAVASAMIYPAVDLAGRTGLGALAVLLSRARLFVANDTGVAHMADALDLPGVVIFTGAPGTSDPVRWGPLDRERRRVGAPPAVVTAAAGESRDPIPLPTETVLEAVEAVLEL